MDNTTTKILETVKSVSRTAKVYYQPPEGTTLDFPCYVVERLYTDLYGANNKMYVKSKVYLINHFSRTGQDETEENELINSFDRVSNITHNKSNGMYQTTYRITTY